MPNKLTLSVIIVTYNRADMLAETLDSIVEQTRVPDEVVIVDNNSTDHTKAVAERYKNKLNIVYVFEGIQGTSTARNTGVKASKGDIIVFTDDDCIADKNWLHYMELPFLRDPSIGIVGGEIMACRVMGTLVEDYCIAESLLRVGAPPEQGGLIP